MKKKHFYFKRQCLQDRFKTQFKSEMAIMDHVKRFLRFETIKNHVFTVLNDT